jgi:hypothetical protein
MVIEGLENGTYADLPARGQRDNFVDRNRQFDVEAILEQ